MQRALLAMVLGLACSANVVPPSRVGNESAACSPYRCDTLGVNCGQLENGCGGTLDCGTCPSGEVCGGDGTPNVCGHGACAPLTCAEAKSECGTLSDGCGALLDCGVCPDHQVCGGDGTPNVCG